MTAHPVLAAHVYAGVSPSGSDAPAVAVIVEPVNIGLADTARLCMTGALFPCVLNDDVPVTKPPLVSDTITVTEPPALYALGAVSIAVDVFAPLPTDHVPETVHV